MGSNPNVPESIANIELSPYGASDFDAFERQRNSGFFSERKWDSHGNSLPEWNPIRTPKGGWAIYSQAFARVVDLDAVTMANYLPWGASTLRSLNEKLHALDPGLASRALEFARNLNEEVVAALQPRLVVVPLSLRSGGETSLSLMQAVSSETFSYPVGASTFNQVLARHKSGFQCLYLRHPSSMQYDLVARAAVVEEVAKVVEKAISRAD
jgi:hypothetical protein